MFKRICSMCLAAIISMVFSFTAYGAAEADSTTAMRMRPLVEKLKSLPQNKVDEGIEKYGDIKRHWVRNYIGKLTQLGVVGGGGKGKFNPDGDMSAAGFIKMVTISLGYKIASSVKPGTEWYDTYVAQAKKDRLIDNGDFKDYTKAITREQAAKILYRAAMLFQEDVKDAGHMGVMRCRIRDYGLIGDSYKDVMVKTYLLGYYTLGASSVSSPKGKFTRAQACTVVIRLLDAEERAEFQVREGEYYIGSDGKKYYPSWSMDPVNAINVVEKSLGKSIGYVDTDIISRSGASWSFFEDKSEAEENSIQGVDFTLGIYTDNSTLHANWLCDITILDREAIKARHKLVLDELFKYFFEKESDKGRKELDNVLQTLHTRVDKEIKINDRYLCIHGTDNITISITCKGGLNSKQYLEKYPD